MALCTAPPAASQRCGGQRPQDWKLSLSNSALERSAATATLKKHPALDTLITLDFASGHHPPGFEDDESSGAAMSYLSKCSYPNPSMFRSHRRCRDKSVQGAKKHNSMAALESTFFHLSSLSGCAGRHSHKLQI